jgi:transcriptional regulator with XRE-family HTH domain
MSKSLNIAELNDALAKAGMNQAALAEKLSVSREAVSKWLKQESFPAPDKLLRIGRLLGLAFDQLVTRPPAQAVPLVEQLFTRGSRYLKAGVVLSGIVPDNAIQYNLFAQPESYHARHLMQAVDNVNFSMRDDVVKFARSGTKKNWKMRQEMRSPRYSTRWEEMRRVE